MKTQTASLLEFPDSSKLFKDGPKDNEKRIASIKAVLTKHLHDGHCIYGRIAGRQCDYYRFVAKAFEEAGRSRIAGRQCDCYRSQQLNGHLLFLGSLPKNEPWKNAGPVTTLTNSISWDLLGGAYEIHQLP